MAHINDNFFKLKQNYLFAEIDKRVTDYKAAHPDRDVVKLGIGDVTLPLPCTGRWMKWLPPKPSGATRRTRATAF